MRCKPFAITLDVGSSLANHTGTWRTERPVYVDRLPPCNHACPAGENIQGWLYVAEDGRATRPPGAQLMQDNPFPAVMGRVCYHPCETACNRAQLDAAVGINSVERFLGDEALRQGWKLPADAAPAGKRVLVVGAGPAGLSAAYHLRPPRPRGRDPRRRRRARRHDALRHPHLPAAPRHPRRRDRPHPRHGRHARAQHQGHRRPHRLSEAARMRAGRLRRRLPGRRRAAQPAAPTSPPATRPASSTRCRCCTAMEDERAAAARPPGRRLRRRQHRDGRRPHRPPARRERSRRRLPPHPRPDARARHRGERGPGGGRHDPVAVDHHARRRGQAADREDEAGRDRLPAADRRVRGAGGRLRWCWRSARTSTCRCSTTCPASTSPTASSRSGPT